MSKVRVRAFHALNFLLKLSMHFKILKRNLFDAIPFMHFKFYQYQITLGAILSHVAEALLL